MPLTSILGILFLNPVSFLLGAVGMVIMQFSFKETTEEKLSLLHPSTKVFDERTGEYVTARKLLIAIRSDPAYIKKVNQRRKS